MAYWLCVCVSLDIVKAFDSVNLLELARFVLQLSELPIRIKFALINEILAPKWVAFLGIGLCTDFVPMFAGIRQGSPEASFLFALFVNHHLTMLTNSWEQRGLCFSFGRHKGKIALQSWTRAFVDAWNHENELADAVYENFRIGTLAFLDDIVLLANDLASMQIMLNELVPLFAKLGLVLNFGKCKWMCDKHVCDVDVVSILQADGHQIERVKELKILGSIIMDDASERVAIDHRISGAWCCYNKWRHVLESSAPIHVRIRFWMKTVGMSLLWCLETTRFDESLNDRLDWAQRRMIKKMMRQKRKPLEKWLDWHIRTSRNAKQLISECNCAISSDLHARRLRWTQHIIRFGLGRRQQHLLKFVLAWRSLGWWNHQKGQNVGFDAIKHAPKIGKIRRYEHKLPLDVWQPVLV